MVLAARPLLALATFASLALGVGALPAAADMVYTAVLDGPTAGTDSPATGTATLILNEAETEISYVVEFSGLVGVENGAHFHNGSPSDVIAPRLLTLNLGTPKIGTWEVGPFEAGELKNGRIFVMIHSFTYNSGEIRGDLTFSTVSTESPTWGAVKALFR